MKIAITGKGGVGKTTIAAGLSLAFAEDNKNVLAIDADPDSNLAATLGFPKHDSIVPISDMKELIQERAGAKGALFTLNPKVDDIPDTCCVEHNGIKLLVMGSIKKAGSGCYCPESALVKALMAHLIVGRNDILIMDMEAGIEHLSRGTSQNVDALLIAVEPSQRSIETAFRIQTLASDLTIKNIFVVGNKIRSHDDMAFIKSEAGSLELLGFVWYNLSLIDRVDKHSIPIYRELRDALIDRMIRER